MSYTLAQLVGKDNAATTVNHPGGYAAGVTSIVVTNAALLPATTPYAIAIGADTANYEEVVVSSVSSNTLTLLTATVNVHADAESVENTVGAEVLKRLADFATAHLHTGGNDGAVLAIPTFATSAPSAVAQSGGLTFTTTRARLFTIGQFVTYVCQITITQAGTSGQAIAVTLPFTWAANAGQAYGAFRYDRNAGASHFGNASQAASTNQIAFAVPTLGFLGANPAFATANGDVLWFTVSGETT